MIYLRSIAFVVTFILWTLFIGVLYLPTLILPRRVCIICARFWLDVTFWLMRVLCGLRYEIRGPIPDGPFLVASKHQSTLETFIFRRDVDDMAVILKRQLLLIPIFGWYLWKTGVIAINRSAGTAALKEMNEGAIKASADGRPIFIFPEGTRRHPDASGDYKGGITYLYSALKVPCVPVALNTGLFWARGSILKKPGVAVIEFLEPIPPGLGRKEFMAELEKRLEPATRALVAEARDKYGV